MSNKAKPTEEITPKLRFPEFRDVGGWQYKELDQIAEIITEKAGNRKFTLMSITSGVGLVSQMEKFGREIAGAAYKNYFVIRKNDFAYNKSATKEYPEGFLVMYSGISEGAVPNSIFTCFRISDDEIIPKYLDYLFSNNIHGKWLRQFIAVGARAHGSLNVDNNDLMLLPIPLPEGQNSKEEQQKIADFLSSLDELIALEGQKLDALKDHKKGLMQELFPAEGETLPKRRFPEFKNAPEWEEVALGKHCEITTGKLDANAMIESGQYRFYTCAKDYYRIDKYAFDTDALLISGNGANVGYIHHYNGKFNAYQRTYVLDKFQENIIFIKYFLERNLKKRIDEEKKAGNTPYIVMSALTEMEIRLPFRDEQKEIANLLSNIDNLIAAQSQKLEALKDHKKGLMQQLFPAPEEVMG